MEQYYGIRVGVTGVEESTAKLNTLSQRINDMMRQYQQVQQRLEQLSRAQTSRNPSAIAAAAHLTGPAMAAHEATAAAVRGGHNYLGGVDPSVNMIEAGRTLGRTLESSLERGSRRMGQEIQIAMDRASRKHADYTMHAFEAVARANSTPGGSAASAQLPLVLEQLHRRGMLNPIPYIPQAPTPLGDSPTKRQQETYDDKLQQYREELLRADVHKNASTLRQATALNLVHTDPQGNPLGFVDGGDKRLVGRFNAMWEQGVRAFESSFSKIAGMSYQTAIQKNLSSTNPELFLRAQGVAQRTAEVVHGANGAGLDAYSRYTMGGNGLVNDATAWQMSRYERDRALRNEAFVDPFMVTPARPRAGGFVDDVTRGKGVNAYLGASAFRSAGYIGEGALIFGGLELARDAFHNTLKTQEHQIRTQQIVDSPTQRAKLNYGLEKLSKDYGVSPAESYDVGFQMQATFGNSSEAITGTKAVLLLTKTATVELKDAMTDLVAITNAYNGGANGMMKTVNGLTNLQNKFGGSIEQNIQALARLGPLFKEYGIDEAHGASYINVIRRQTGASGEQIASRLERIVPLLQNKQTQKVLSTIGVKDNLGIDATSFYGEIDAQDIIDKLAAGVSSGKMNKTDLERVVVAMGGPRNAADLVPIIARGKDVQNEVAAYEEGTRGHSAEERWSAISQSALQQMAQLRTAFILLIKNVADAGLLQGFTQIIHVFGLAAKAADTIVGGITRFTTAMGPLGTILKTVGALALTAHVGGKWLNSEKEMGETWIGRSIKPDATDDLGQMKREMTRRQYYSQLFTGAKPLDGKDFKLQRDRYEEVMAHTNSLRAEAGMDPIVSRSERLAERRAAVLGARAERYAAGVTGAIQNGGELPNMGLLSPGIYQSVMARRDAIEQAQERLNVLDARLGTGVGAVSERSRMNNIISSQQGKLQSFSVDADRVNLSQYSPAFLTQFMAGFKAPFTGAMNMFTRGLERAAAATQAFAASMRANSVGFLAPGSTGFARRGLEGLYTRRVGARIAAEAGVTAELGEQAAGLEAAGLGAGSLLAAPLGMAAGVGLAGVGVLAVGNSISKGIQQDAAAKIQAAKDRDTLRQNLAGAREQGNAVGGEQFAEIYQQAATMAAKEYDSKSWMNHLVRQAEGLATGGQARGSDVLTGLRYSDIDWSKYSKDDLKQLDLKVGSDGNFVAHNSRFVGGANRRSDDYIDDKTAQKLSDITKEKELKQWRDQLAGLAREKGSSTALPVELMQFQHTQAMFNMTYGGTGVDVVTNAKDPLSGAPGVKMGSAGTLASTIDQTMTQIANINDQITVALEGGHEAVVESLVAAKQQAVQDLDTIQNQSEQTSAAIGGFFGSAGVGAALKAAADRANYDRLIAGGGDANSPEAKTRLLTALQSQQAAVAAPFDAATTANETLLNLTVTPEDKVKALRQAANLAQQKAQALIGMMGGTQSPVVQQAMATAVQANKSVMDALNQATQDAISATANRESAGTGSAVKKAEIALKAAREKLAAYDEYVAKAKGVLTDSSGNAVIDRFISSLMEQAKQQTSDVDNSASQLSTAADSLIKAAQDLGNAASLLAGNAPAGTPGENTADTKTDTELKSQNNKANGVMEVKAGEAGYRAPTSLSFQQHGQTGIKGTYEKTEGGYYYYKDAHGTELRVDKSGHVQALDGGKWKNNGLKDVALPTYKAPVSQVHPEWFNNGKEAPKGYKWQDSTGGMHLVPDVTHSRMWSQNVDSNGKPTGDVATPAPTAPAAPKTSDTRNWLKGIGLNAVSGIVVTPHGENTGDHAKNSYHYKNEAIDFGAAGNDPKKLSSLAGFLESNYASQLAELIYKDPRTGKVYAVKDGKALSQKDAYKVYGTKTLNQHMNHVHTAATPQTITGGAGVGGSVAGGVDPARENYLADIATQEQAEDRARLATRQAQRTYQAGPVGSYRQLTATFANAKDAYNLAKKYDDQEAMFRAMQDMDKTAYEMAMERASRVQMRMRLHGDSSNPYQAAKAAADTATMQMKAYLDNGGKKTDTEYGNLAATQKESLRDAGLAKVTMSHDKLDYQFNMHQIGWQSYILGLRKLASTVDRSTYAGEQLWRSINEQIMGLVQSLGQFNLPDIGRLMPTVYEGRRVVQDFGQVTTGMNMAGKSSYQMSSSQLSRSASSNSEMVNAVATGVAQALADQPREVTIQVNGADLEKVKAIIKAQLGSAATNRVAVAPRKVT